LTDKEPLQPRAGTRGKDGRLAAVSPRMRWVVKRQYDHAIAGWVGSMFSRDAIGSAFKP